MEKELLIKRALHQVNQFRTQEDQMNRNEIVSIEGEVKETTTDGGMFLGVACFTVTLTPAGSEKIFRAKETDVQTKSF